MSNTTNETTVQLSQKSVVVELAASILEALDSKFAEYVQSETKLITVYEKHTDIEFFEKSFKDTNPATLVTVQGVEMTFPYNINDAFFFKDVVNSLRQSITDAKLAMEAQALSKGTYLEDFYKSNEEVSDVITKAEKHATKMLKTAFNLWSNLLSAKYEEDYNLMLETSIINNQFRIVGLWTLSAARAKETEFYVNPDYLTDALNVKFKALEKFSNSADDLSETMNAIKAEDVFNRVAVGITASLNQLPSTLSSAKDLLKSCKGYQLSAGKGTEATAPKGPTAPSKQPVSPVEEI